MNKNKLNIKIITIKPEGGDFRGSSKKTKR